MPTGMADPPPEMHRRIGETRKFGLGLARKTLLEDPDGGDFSFVGEDTWMQQQFDEEMYPAPAADLADTDMAFEEDIAGDAVAIAAPSPQADGSAAAGMNDGSSTAEARQPGGAETPVLTTELKARIEAARQTAIRRRDERRSQQQATVEGAAPKAMREARQRAEKFTASLKYGGHQP